eukprot:s6525_g1.t1
MAMKFFLVATSISCVVAGIPRLEIALGSGLSGSDGLSWIGEPAEPRPGPVNHAIPPLGNMIFDETETDQAELLAGWFGRSWAALQRAQPRLLQVPASDRHQATWGKKGQPCNPANPGQMAGCDFIDMSLVDGFTLPFKLEVDPQAQTITSLDCSGLSVDKCPVDDNLGKGPTNMQAINPKIQKPVGCYAPCLKLIDTKWNNVQATGKSRNDPDVTKYCCTTPPENSQTCNAGPLPQTKYVQTVHQYCPGVYAFAYDDGQGLMRCSYGQYRLTFMCPGVPLADQKFEEEKEDLFFSSCGAVTFVLFAAVLGVGLALAAIHKRGFRDRWMRPSRNSDVFLPPEWLSRRSYTWGQVADAMIRAGARSPLRHDLHIPRCSPSKPGWLLLDVQLAGAGVLLMATVPMARRCPWARRRRTVSLGHNKVSVAGGLADGGTTPQEVASRLELQRSRPQSHSRARRRHGEQHPQHANGGGAAKHVCAVCRRAAAVRQDSWDEEEEEWIDGFDLQGSIEDWHRGASAECVVLEARDRHQRALSEGRVAGHEPVLLVPTMQWLFPSHCLANADDELSVRSGNELFTGLYVDCTFGRGGYSREILSRLSEEQQYVYV